VHTYYSQFETAGAPAEEVVPADEFASVEAEGLDAEEVQAVPQEEILDVAPDLPVVPLPVTDVKVVESDRIGNTD
jgi:hypothetical protein